MSNWDRLNPSSAPSEAGAQEADCPSSNSQKAWTAERDFWRDHDALTERVRVLEEALRKIQYLPISPNARTDAFDMRTIARKALSGGGE